MLLFQVLIIGFTLFAVSKTISGFKKGRINTTGLIIWLSLWTVIVLASFLPNTTTFFANILGVNYGTDLAVYLSIMALFYIVFRIYIKLEKIESAITTIVKEIALKSKRNKT